jgi:transposase
MAALLTKFPRTLTAMQNRHLEDFLQFCPKARQLRGLALRFRGLLRGNSLARLAEWMEKVKASGFPFLAQFARTLGQDRDAVQLAITTPWSNKVLEGHINRLKVIKRQMYGRASKWNLCDERPTQIPADKPTFRGSMKILFIS